MLTGNHHITATPIISAFHHKSTAHIGEKSTKEESTKGKSTKEKSTKENSIREKALNTNSYTNKKIKITMETYNCHGFSSRQMCDIKSPKI